LHEQGLSVYGIARKRTENAIGTVLTVDMLDERALSIEFEKLPSIDLAVFAQGISPSSNLSDMTKEHARTSNAAAKGSYDPSYAAAKGATVSLTKSLAKELKDRVRVTCIAPGLVADSPVHRSMTPEHAATHEARMFGNRLVRGEEVARLIWEIYRNPALNGCVIPIDGGYCD
jgi:hypothetical protein